MGQVVNIFVAIMVFSVGIAAFSFVIGDLMNRYTFTTDVAFESSFDFMNETFGVGQNLSESFRNSSGSAGTGIDDFWNSAVGSMKILFRSFDFVESIGDSIRSKLTFIPPWIPLAFFGIFLIVLTFYVISALLKAPL